MSGKVFFAYLSFLLILSFKSYCVDPPVYNTILTEFSRADKLFNSPENSITTDSLCMVGFRTVITELGHLTRERKTDSLMYEASFRLGVIQEVYKSYTKAIESYTRAIKYSINPEQKFKMYVYAGAGYYNVNNFDSATFFLLRAADSPEDIGSSEDHVRLYNTLGVLYNDNGNYLQSKNYFIQALKIIETKNLVKELSIYTQLNLAASYYKLGENEKALEIYKKVTSFQLVPDLLNMNMGRAYASLHQYAMAMKYYKKVKASVMPGVLNEMAITDLENGSGDSALYWLNVYQHNKEFFHTNELDDGVNQLYFGNLNLNKGDPESALIHLQTALIVFSRDFKDPNTRKNPVNFTGSFAYYRLFDVLFNKAKAWEMIYKKTSQPDDLRAAYESYQATISFLSYIEKSYEMDDAKILLKQKCGEVYTNALRVCLRLDELFPGTGFLESAFLITEKNKASVMNSQLREKNLLVSTGSGNNLEGQERNIKFNIARLNSKAEGEIDSKTLKEIGAEKSEYEIQLVNLRRKMEGDKKFYQLKYSDDFPTVERLQKAMGSNQALISFFNTADKIELFILGKTSLYHTELDSGELIRRNTGYWIQNLQNMENGRHDKKIKLQNDLFEELIKPIVERVGDVEEWIMIPDGLFFQLPFESLPCDKNGTLVLETHAISYEFSSRFLIEEQSHSAQSLTGKNILSFAPFSKKSAELKTESLGWLEKLPYSEAEIASLAGRRFEDSAATKNEFLNNLNQFSIIHLATHAITDLNNPSASFIAFYPTTGSKSEDFLFLDEIYSLRLDSCKMMVISACETGRGELVKNEGVMSFARAFLYAGCPSTINTLWKADDHSTSEIFKLFYGYLEAGYSKSRALQKAKLDFIKNNPIYRDPAYWSHIVLTGDPGSLYARKRTWIWVSFLMGGGIIFLMLKKRS
jgi:CHAT domain-containing protein